MRSTQDEVLKSQLEQALDKEQSFNDSLQNLGGSDIIEKQVSEPIFEKCNSIQNYLVEKQVIAFVNIASTTL
jgi:hypothetical protein